MTFSLVSIQPLSLSLTLATRSICQSPDTYLRDLLPGVDDDILEHEDHGAPAGALHIRGVQDHKQHTCGLGG